MISSTTLPTPRPAYAHIPDTTVQTHAQDHVADLNTLIRMYNVLIATGLITPNAGSPATGTVMDLTKFIQLDSTTNQIPSALFPTINFEGIDKSVVNGVDTFTFNRDQLAAIIGNITTATLAANLKPAVDSLIASYLATNPA